MRPFVPSRSAAPDFRSKCWCSRGWKLRLESNPNSSREDQTGLTPIARSMNQLATRSQKAGYSQFIGQEAKQSGRQPPHETRLGLAVEDDFAPITATHGSLARQGIV